MNTKSLHRKGKGCIEEFDLLCKLIKLKSTDGIVEMDLIAENEHFLFTEEHIGSLSQLKHNSEKVSIVLKRVNHVRTY